MHVNIVSLLTYLLRSVDLHHPHWRLTVEVDYAQIPNRKWNCRTVTALVWYDCFNPALWLPHSNKQFTTAVSCVCTPGVGLLVMIWLELCTSCSCSCHLSHSSKMQNEDILVPVDLGLPGKWLLKCGESIRLCGPPWVWMIIHCMCWLTACEIWFCRWFSWECLIDQSPSD